MSFLTFHIPPFPTFIKGGQFSFKAGNRHFKRTFSVFDMLYVKKGELHMTENGVPYSVRDGEYLVLIPGREHYGHRESTVNTEVYWLHFKAEGEFGVHHEGHDNWLDAQKKEADFEQPAEYQFRIRQKARLEHPLAAEKLLENLLSITSQSADFPLRQQLYFQELMVHLQKEALNIPTAAEQVTNEAIQFLQAHYHKEIRMEDLSRNILFHQDYITRCMQKTLGLTPSQYLNQYRLSQAKRLLATTDDKIASIAAETGIMDATYFSKLFRKTEGMTPNEYRKVINRLRD
ncbi:AraC family transcriptional regulator [Metabacillus sp. FJAT-52054]|uniref:AraC family transcriptional regulator n=1 Tax=Metabacillus sediminis TaxID=3117746 RepID=A0ABZ2NJW5_9BACI